MACEHGAGKHAMPDWKAPGKEGKLLTGLKMNNSMTGTKVEFVPNKDRTVTWYGCGPTVYDASHMGHARTYVSFDVLRRIMEEYFGYEVKMVMNVTDIDDKIIKRSNEQGKQFTEVARHWEQEFWNDMKALNVKLPDVITRVSEYVEEIIAFTDKIIKNGYAYESEGSVYFDVEAFKKSQKHVYGRMEPWSVQSEARVLEGEGELGIVSQKKCAFDFALWKKAKEGEPSWDSPWGKGRPGWHIECSAMASAVLGFPIDIHSGGIDLRFPHHDNELAQSEACYDEGQWVNYFLHSGHLHIDNLKMSKSLKNFITIKDILKEFKPRHIRFLCLMHRWDAPMNYAPNGDSMKRPADVDRKFSDFFGLVRHKLRSAPIQAEQKMRPAEEKLREELDKKMEEVHRELLDSFNTPDALVALQHIASEVYIYINQTSEGSIRLPLVKKAATYVFKMLKTFGITTGDAELLNYDDDANVAQGAAAGGEAAVAPFVDLIAGFREQVRNTAQAAMKATEVGEVKEGSKGLLKACDQLRDEQLPDLGVRLEDRPDGSVWKIVDKEELAREKARKQEEEEKKRKEKEENARKLAEQKAKKELEARTPPEQYYRAFKADEFSEVDAEGLPVTDKEGKPVSKAAREKAKKFLTKHKEVYDKWLASQANGAQ